MPEFLSDVMEIRRRAREKMSDGAITDSYTADRKQVIDVLNDVLATEIVCVLRYKRHFYIAQGINAEPVAAEFLQHATDEQMHADQVALRITQLGGEPDFNPAGLVSKSHAEYTEGGSLVQSIQEDLVAERVAIISYNEIIRWLDTKDVTTRRMIEDILAKEEEHADDLVDLLTTLDPKPA